VIDEGTEQEYTHVMSVNFQQLRGPDTKTQWRVSIAPALHRLRALQAVRSPPIATVIRARSSGARAGGADMQASRPCQRPSCQQQHEGSPACPLFVSTTSTDAPGVMSSAEKCSPG
jgi:hypothetical protein